MKNTFKEYDNYVSIDAVCRGEKVTTLVDYDTFKKLKFHKGTIHISKSTSGTMYAYLQWQVQKKSMSTQLHHVVMGFPEKGLVVDHINRNGLDNRRSNLRFLKEIENHWNVSMDGRTQKGKHSTGHLHISYLKFKGNMRYRVRVSRSGIDKHLGYFVTLDEAIKARDNYLKEIEI